MAIISIAAKGDETDWINFAAGANGPIAHCYFFRENGKLSFGSAEMRYQDTDINKVIPYSGSSYIYFTANKASGIEIIQSEPTFNLVYSSSTNQILVVGSDSAELIRIFSLDGSHLRTTVNTNYISTDGLTNSMVIVTATNKGETISNKFMIK